MKQIFINLPVQDPDRSMAFYQQLGFTVNPLFTFDDQKCMAWGEHIYVMLQNADLFKKGNRKPLADAKQTTIATFTLPVDSSEQMNAIMEQGLQAGGTEAMPMIDEGFMQVRNLEDLDGHIWGIIYIDIAKFKLVTGK